jgi:hypothetical protein
MAGMVLDMNTGTARLNDERSWAVASKGLDDVNGAKRKRPQTERKFSFGPAEHIKRVFPSG